MVDERGRLEEDAILGSVGALLREVLLGVPDARFLEIDGG